MNLVKDISCIKSEPELNLPFYDNVADLHTIETKKLSRNENVMSEDDLLVQAKRILNRS